MNIPTIIGQQAAYDIPLEFLLLPTSVPASGSVFSSSFPNNGFSALSISFKSTQAGSVSVQRYLDAGATIQQGAPYSASFSANTQFVLNIEPDGTPWQSFVITVTNSSGTIATLSNIKVLLFTSYISPGANSGTVSIDQTTSGTTNGVDSGPKNAIAINLSGDTTPSPALRGIWVGVTGNIKVDFIGAGAGITIPNVPVGYLSGHFSKVYSTANGTTATNLVGVW